MSLLEDHKVLVELACSATLAPAYAPEFFSKLLESRKEADKPKPEAVVFIVCGGVKISLDEVYEYQHVAESFKKENAGWTVTVDGGQVDVPFL